MTRSLLVAWREVRAFLKDRGDLAFSLLLPIAIFAISYGAFGGQFEFHGTLHVVNEDQGGEYSALLLERLEDVSSLDVDELSASDANRKLNRSDLLMVLFIPQDFSDKLACGEQAELVFKQRGNGGEEGQIVASIVSGIAGEMAGRFQVLSQVENYLAGTGISQDRIEVTVERWLVEEGQNPAVRVVEDTLGQERDPVYEFLPGIVTMFILFAITMAARSLVEERKIGTLERLHTTRLTVGELFVGKFLANIGRGFLQTLILFLLSYAVFQMFTPLSFVETMVVALIFTAAVSAIGLIIGSASRSEDQATWTAVFFTMVMVMLGGTFFEISEGSVLDALSKVSINTYANDALKTVIVEEGSLADVGLELGVLAGVAVVGLFVARRIFKVVPGGK